MAEFVIEFGKPGKVFGYVRAIKSYDPTRSPAFSVEIYLPTAAPAKRTQWFSLDKVCDNRELVFVSLLRDALVHSLPVELRYDKIRFINHVEIRTRTYYEEGKIGTIEGKVKMISVDEFGIWKGNTDYPNTATVVISSKTSYKELYLNLQRSEKDTKMAQLLLLKQAYEDDSKVTVRYQNAPTLGGKGTVKLIVGVQVGSYGKVITPPLIQSYPQKL